MSARSERRARLWAFLFIFAFLGSWYFYHWFFKRTPPVPEPAPPPPAAAAQPAPSMELTPLEFWKFENEASLSGWERKVFKGTTRYEVRGDGSDRRLHAESADSSVGLFMKTKHEAVPGMYLRWKWRALQFPKKKEPTRLSSRAEDDFAARVYVIFEASNLFRSDVIEYVWDESLPVGTVADSAYSERIKLFVIRSGAPAADGSMQEETRSPLEDYQRLFGKPPKYPVGIVALLCDSDNTGTSAEADFGDILLGTGKK